MTVIRGRFKKPRWRLVFSNLYCAREEYECYDCPIPIFPLDEYIREVWIWEHYDENGRWGGQMEVRIIHLHCPYDPDEERRRNELEDEFDRECEEHDRERAEEELPDVQPQVA